MQELTPELIEHLWKKPIRPSALKCTLEEWAEYDRTFREWAFKKDLLEVNAVKHTLDLRASSDSRYGELFLPQ